MLGIVFWLALIVAIGFWFKVTFGRGGAARVNREKFSRGVTTDPSERLRDVTHIDDGTVGERILERVSSTPEPIKPLRRRMTHRDFRLLPKTDDEKFHPRAERWGPRKRRSFMSKDEATRLFSPTLITKNRDIRDLAPDPEQLARLQLPLWKTEQDLADALGLPVKVLRFFSLHKAREKVLHYITFAIAKRGGGERLIMAPKRRLKAIQRSLNAQLAAKLPQSDFAHAFRAGRSIKSNAAPHVGKPVVIKLDLQNFFPTITYPRVRGYLIGCGYSYPIAAILAVLMTEAPRQPVLTRQGLLHVPVGQRALPQGAPTSPAVANAIATKLDHRLAGIAKKHGFAYSRYADDLTFSGENLAIIKTLIGQARRVIEDEGFKLNSAKTRVLQQGRSQQIAGVTVNCTLGLSRTTRRRIRAALHQHGLSSRVRGMLAYLRMLNAGQAERASASPRKDAGKVS
jgi:RNA-directed DNA polymerase